MSELKPCPFCGGEAEIDFSSVTDYGNRSHQSGDVTCKNRDCDAEVGLYDFNPDDKSISPTEILVSKWNARAPQNEWISVSSYKEIPVGIWKVAELKRNGDTEMHIANIASNFSVIGGAFAFDRHKIYAYSSCGTLPPPKEI